MTGGLDAVNRELARQITGSENPSTNRVHIAIIVGILLCLLVSTLNYFQTSALEDFLKRPDLTIRMFYDKSGEIFPITVDNTGEVTLTDLNVSVQSCYMSYPRVYHIEKLEPNRQHVVPFYDGNTSRIYDLRDCKYGKVNFSDYSVTVTPYRDPVSKKIYHPTINQTLYVCGICYWRVNITSSQINRSFYEEVNAPIGMSAYVQGTDPERILPSFEKIDDIEFTIFGLDLLETLRYS